MNYDFKDNTYLATPKDHWPDRIQVEIGDSKQPLFFPQLKLMRWDNEVNASFRMIDDTPTQAAVRTQADQIVWSKGDTEVHFYDLPISEQHPEGGYEFEIVLKKKPKTNIVQMSMQTKGLEFFYQPPLTQEEIDHGASRPENVVSSYAVYYKDCPANYEGGKLYRVGKAFHIFRPRIEDAVGNWVWGELSIDKANGLLTVTIPQDFLDNAVYPVRHAAGLTFGFAGDGGSQWGPYQSASGSLFTSPSNMTNPTSMSVRYRLDAGPPSDRYKSCIYLHSTLALVANSTLTSGSLTSATATWNTINFGTAPTISASTDYVLMVGFIDNGFLVWYYDSGSANQGHEGQGGTFATGVPDPLSVASHNTNKYSIYCTYTAGGGTAVKDLIGCGIIPFAR